MREWQIKSPEQCLRQEWRSRREANPHVQVYYPLSDIIPDWQPPKPTYRKALADDVVPTLKKSKAEGKTLRELAQETGVSHETIRPRAERRMRPA